MTISSTANKAILYGNGVATSFPYKFLIPKQNQLSVIVTDPLGNQTTLTAAQYSVSGINSPNGGAVTYPLSGLPLAALWSITILRTLPIVQQTDIVNQNGFYPDVVESAMDYQTMTQQQLSEAQSRSISFPVVDDQTAITPVLPAAAARATKPLIFDASGNVVTGQQSYQEPQTLLDSAKATAEVIAAGVAPGSGTGTFIANGAGAVVRTFQDKMRDRISVADFGARYTQSGSVNTTQIQKALDDLSGSGVDLYFDEPLNIAGGLELPPGVTLRFGIFASLTAVNPMGAMVQTPLGTLVENSGIYGGSFFCNNMADSALDLQYFRTFNLQNFYWQDWLTDGVIAGNPAAAASSYGLQTLRVNSHRPVTAIPAGSRAIYLRAASDNELAHTVPVGGEIGVQCDTGGNVFAFVHPWARVSTGLMKKGFLINGDDCYFTGCYADTPSEHGWLLNGNNYTLDVCRAFNNGAVADLAAVGMEFTSTDPRSFVLGFQCEAIDNTHRFAIDVKAPFQALQSLTIKSNGYNLATRQVQNDPTPYSYGANTAQGGFHADGPAASNARGFVISTNGKTKWVIRSDNSSEPVDGSNTGCNLQIDRYDDNGTNLGQPIFIQRSNGVVSMTDAGINVAGIYTKPLFMGANALWVDGSGVLRIKNGTPTSDTDGTIVGAQ